MRKLLSCLIFCLLLFLSVNKLNEILIPKANNRYYMLEKELEKNNKFYDLQIYGSCHSYTSFNPTYLKENYNIDSFVYGNPGEIIPVTYLRMLEQFKRYTPKVALVELWGINPYETYDKTERILGDYLLNNIELIPFSLQKLEVINDFNLNIVEMNFPIYRYKDRIVNNSLSVLDFNYSFEETKQFGYKDLYDEMKVRFKNNGFKENNPKIIENYLLKQEKIDENDYLEIETNIVKYIEKIIKLCQDYNVKLIFYRAPYYSKKNELLKLKHFDKIAKDNNVDYVNLENTIEYDFEKDYNDIYHLSVNGANKSTDYLMNNYLIKYFN